MSEYQLVIVDDTDTDSIKYTGPWFASKSSQFDYIGSFGKPFGGTLHGTKSNASFSFTFSGTSVDFFTTQEGNNSSSSAVFSVECRVLVSNLYSSGVLSPMMAGSRLRFCNIPTMLDGEHTVIVNVALEANSAGQTFWLDYITYRPSPETPLDNALVAVYTPDPRLQFGSGWTSAEQNYSGFIIPMGNKTTARHSTFTMDFIGKSLTWFGFKNMTVDFESTTATYSVDDGPPTTFNISGTTRTQNVEPLAHQEIFFQTPTYSLGHHTLKVVYDGDAQENSHPLTLNYIVIHNGSSDAAAAIPSNPVTSDPTDDQTIAPPNSKSPVGPIVGGIVGGLTIIALIFMLFFLRRRRRYLAVQGNDSYSIDESLHNETPKIEPYVAIQDEEVFGSKSGRLAPSSPLPESSAPSTTVAATSQQNEKSNLRRIQNSGAESLIESNSQPAQARAPPSQRESLTPRNSMPVIVSNLAGNHTLASQNSRIVLRDEDSGIRLSSSHGNHDEVVLLPPEYTPS
ncbi:hypothetical protein JR316_0001782 [Psilocybe cubensis]|uniref:Uncharacterized protein n=2 Tax=Psilocybe cubensis TaxID=181762 RepID=A0A8H7Y2E4_PSICU|nr:hypothetical protein JR316_0001782 [Psilocybe cubensis]KAH9484880.1 hypothetical protein JR316_0001782 [Psilocybe cubensis]